MSIKKTDISAKKSSFVRFAGFIPFMNFIFLHPYGLKSAGSFYLLFRSGDFQCLFNVSYDIIHILNAHGEADQVGTYACFNQLLVI